MDKKEIEERLGMPLMTMSSPFGWLCSIEKFGSDWEKAELEALKQLELQCDCDALIFAGMVMIDGVLRLYVVPNAHPLDVLVPCEVGAPRNGRTAEDKERCHAELRRVYDIIPFRPYGVGPAEYKCVFNRDVSNLEASQIDDILTEGLEGYASEMEDSWDLAQRILLDNGLKLWWG